VKGAIAPHQWDRNPDELYPWLEWALMAESVENEVEAERSAQKNPKSARQPYHVAHFDHSEE